MQAVSFQCCPASDFSVSRLEGSYRPITRTGRFVCTRSGAADSVDIGAPDMVAACWPSLAIVFIFDIRLSAAAALSWLEADTFADTPCDFPVAQDRASHGGDKAGAEVELAA